MTNYLLISANAILNILVICVSLFLLYLIVCFIATAHLFKLTFKRNEKAATQRNPIYNKYKDLLEEGEKYFFSLSPEEITLTSFDNLKLFAYFYNNPQAKGTVIFMHGYHGNPVKDFGPVLKLFKELGFSILLPYQRAHGKSEGDYLTFGVKECNDCLKWAKYIANRFPNLPISLHGISMGGATVAMTATLPDLPKEVKLIANDCGFTSPDKIVAAVRNSMKIPRFPFHYFARFLAKTRAKFSLLENDASECYAKNPLPSLFIHGEKDGFVPYYMGKENYEKSISVDKVLVSVKDADHGLSYITEPERVTKILVDFYQKHMK
ncbi:MAG: alpha/beta hydrolase [Clostridia bacterium]|nr:alpha/beta hydrolase [Clostridia bacterium]